MEIRRISDFENVYIEFKGLNLVKPQFVST